MSEARPMAPYMLHTNVVRAAEAYRDGPTSEAMNELFAAVDALRAARKADSDARDDADLKHRLDRA